MPMLRVQQNENSGYFEMMCWEEMALYNYDIGCMLAKWIYMSSQSNEICNQYVMIESTCASP